MAILQHDHDTFSAYQLSNELVDDANALIESSASDGEEDEKTGKQNEERNEVHQKAPETYITHENDFRIDAIKCELVSAKINRINSK